MLLYFNNVKITLSFIIHGKSYRLAKLFPSDILCSFENSPMNIYQRDRCSPRFQSSKCSLFHLLVYAQYFVISNCVFFYVSAGAAAR